VSDFHFPKKLKDNIDSKLWTLVSSYESAIQQAHATNIKIASKDQIKRCAGELKKFQVDVLTPLKQEIAVYEKLNVEGNDKTEAMFALATDLSISCGMYSADLVMGTLSHCLLIMDTN
jgi:uncharacterized coiled-coil DUF342 family protein